MTRAIPLLLLFLFSFPLAAARELGPRPPAPSTYEPFRISVAASGGQFLTVWREWMRGLGIHIKGAFSDAEGRRTSPLALTLVPNIADPAWVQVAGTDDGFALFWRIEGERVRMADVDRLGRVSNMRTLDIEAHFNSRVAWNGTHFLIAVARPAPGGWEGALLDRSGHVVRRGIALANQRISDVRILTDGRDFVVITSGHSVGVVRVREDGSVDAVSVEAVTGTHGSVAAGALAADGSVLVAWSGQRGRTAELRAARVSGEGVVSRATVVAGEAVYTPLAMMPRGGAFVLAYLEQAAPLARGTVNGLLLDANANALGEPHRGGEARVGAGATNGNVILAATTLVVEEEPWVSGTVIGGDAVPRPREPLAIAPERQLDPALVAGGGRLLAAWSQFGGNDSSTPVAALTADGEPLRHESIEEGELASRELAWSGTEALVLHRDATRLLATRVDPNGEAIDVRPIVIAPLPKLPRGDRPAAAIWTGSAWLVAWRDAARLWSSTISASGVAGEPRPLPVETPIPAGWLREYVELALVTDGTNRVLLWREWQAPPCMMPACDPGRSPLFAVRLSPTGELLGTPAELLSGAGALSAASNGGEIVVLAGTRAFVLRGDTLQSGASRELFGWPAAGDLTWDGREFVAALRYAGMRWHLALHRFGANLHATSSPRGVVTPPSETVDAPSVAAARAFDAAIALDEGDAEGSRAVLYGEDELQPLPAPPSAPQNVRVRQVDQYRHQVTWEAPASGEVEMYVVEVPSLEGWSVLVRLPPDARAYTSYYHVYRVRAFNAGGISPAAGSQNEPKRRTVRSR